jgi:tetratricopeptide (TPR) repeat protein
VTIALICLDYWTLDATLKYIFIMKTIDFSYFIERYNAGEMDDAEKKWFIKELNNNEKLRKEVELRRRTDAVLKDRDILNLRNKLAAIEKSREAPIPTWKPGRHINIKYAAAIAGFVLIGSIALLSNRHMNSNEIVNRFYKPYEATASLRSEETVNNQDYKLALEYYNIHDYRNAATYFKKVLASDPGNMHSEFLSGISNFENQDYPGAKGSFSKVIADNNNYYIDHAQWYLALCYLKTDEKLKAIDQLTIIKKSKTIYRKDARKILRSLN